MQPIQAMPYAPGRAATVAAARGRDLHALAEETADIVAAGGTPLSPLMLRRAADPVRGWPDRVQRGASLPRRPGALAVLIGRGTRGPWPPGTSARQG